MDRSEVRAIVGREIGPLMQRLGIDHWDVTVSYASSAEDSDGWIEHGRCTRMIDYNKATITLNPESFNDEMAVLKTLRHELFHVVLAPFDLYSSAVDQVIDGDHAAHGLVDRVWTHACEGAVIALERMYRGLTSA
jgi:hypothetical protein